MKIKFEFERPIDKMVGEKRVCTQLEKEEPSSSWQQPTGSSFKVEGQSSIKLENNEVCDNNKTGINRKVVWNK